MDDYDNEQYGMDYEDYYGYGGKPDEETTESPARLEPIVDNPALVSLSTFDSNRSAELQLEQFDFPRQSKYPVSRYYVPDKAPAVAIAADNRRHSIHPLGVTDKPAGVSEALWAGLDIDNIYPETLDFTVHSDAVALTVPEASVPAAPTEAASGGSGGDVPVDRDDEDDDARDPSEMPFLDHLEEFRWSMLKSIIAVVTTMIASWFLTKYFWATIIRLAENAEIPLISTKLMEGIMMKLQMTFVMGLLIALPFVFYFLWSFVSPGLYKREKKWILPLVFAATICFFIGASIAYFIIIPFILPFIKAFLMEGIDMMITIGDFVGNMLKFTLLFGIVFEMPLISYFLAKLGVLKHTFMVQYRRYAIIVIFVLGAIFTPPDPISQIMMAMPLILLYEVSIWVARFAGRKTIL